MRRHRAFTLIELLVTITIIAILAALALGVVALARESGREAATRATLAKINRVLRPIRDEVWVQRLPANTTNSATGLIDPKLAANMRRELLLIEMPDRWSDILRDPLVLPLQHTAYGQPVPTKYRALLEYRQRLRVAIARLQQRGLSPTEIDAKLRSWESAECLYRIVMDHGGNQQHWGPRAYGDLDNDGLREFHDAWGTPIAFLRWPAGWPGACPHIPTSRPEGIEDQVWMADGTDRYPVGADIMGPTPVAYSAGPDGQFDTNRGVQHDGHGGYESYEYRLDGHGNLNPWTADLQGNLIGLPLDSISPNGEPADGSEGWHDNITTEAWGQ